MHRPAVIVSALLLVATAAAAQPVDVRVRSLAATCTACHGTDSQAAQGGAMVALAGYPRAALVAQMQAFRDGSRPATVMHQIARGYTDEQIDVLAAYFAAQPARRP